MFTERLHQKKKENPTEPHEFHFFPHATLTTKKKNQRTVTKPNRTENQTERNETDENKNYKRWREQS